MHTWRKWKADLVVKVKAAKKMKKRDLQDLLAFLLKIDKTVGAHGEMQLLVEADELFNTVFKITYYEAEHAVCNCALAELRAEQAPLTHE